MGSVAKRKDRAGKWEARWRDPSGRQRRKTFALKRDAETYLRTVEESLTTGSYVPPSAGRATVGTVAEAWLRRQHHLKPSTVASYRSLLDTCILPEWRTVPLDRVTRPGVADWLTGLSGRLSASRSRQAYVVLSRVLDSAVKDSLIPRNPATGVDLPRLPRSERRYLTAAQLGALADGCGEYRTLVLLLGYTGLRWGEASALRVGDIDHTRGRVHVVRSTTDLGGRLVTTTPKSGRGRTVPVPPFLAQDLTEASRGKDLGDLLFTSMRGGPLRLGNWRRNRFDRAAKAAGVEGLTPHELRHTAASLAIRAGASVKAVQSMLGHSSATITLDRYGHLFEDEYGDVQARMASTYAGAQPVAQAVAQEDAADAGVAQAVPTPGVVDLRERQMRA